MGNNPGLYLAIAAVIVVTPGADTALVMRNAAARGLGCALRTIGGIALGLAIWAALAVAVVAGAVSISPGLFSVIRYVGVAYLLYLGIHFLVSSYRGGPADAGAAPERSFRQGLLTNVTNPKVGLFYTSFMPQFIDPQGAVVSSCILLSLIHIALSVTSLTAYGFLTVQARRFFKGPRFRRALDGIAGVALIGLGVRLLWE